MIYIVVTSCRKFAKVGFTTDMSKRLPLLQSGLPERISFWEAREGGRPLEAACHDALKSQKLHSEWFRFSDSVLEVFRETPDPERCVGSGVTFQPSRFLSEYKKRSIPVPLVATQFSKISRRGPIPYPVVERLLKEFAKIGECA